MVKQEVDFGLSPNIIASLITCFKKYPAIEKVMIFGSRAKNTYKDGSDIDLAVFAPIMQASEFALLWGEIEDLLLVFKIDLIHWDILSNEKLKEKIATEGKIFL